MAATGETTTAPSDEEMRKLLKPNPTPDDVIAALRASHGRAYTVVRQLDSYDDVNYLVVDAVIGTRYLAKVHNGVESQDYEARQSRDSVIDLQHAIFEHLGGPGCPDITTSAPVPALDGAPVAVHPLPVVAAAHSPCRLAVRLLTWVDGTPMVDLPGTQGPEDLAAAGRYLGRLRDSLDELAALRPETARAATRYHAWDGRRTADLSEYLHCIDDPGGRALVAEVLAAFRAAFGEEGEEAGAGADLPWGILQGDFNDANIIVRDGKVAGVIDFGDCVHSWRVLDVSVAMAYAMLTALGKSGHSLAAMASLLRGFHSVQPLTGPERRHLRLLVACRLCTSVTLGAYSHRQNPGNAYLLLHAAPAWSALALVWRGGGGDGAEAIDRLLDRACAQGGDCADLALPDRDVVDASRASRAAVDGDADEATQRPARS